MIKKALPLIIALAAVLGVSYFYHNRAAAEVPAKEPAEQQEAEKSENEAQDPVITPYTEVPPQEPAKDEVLEILSSMTLKEKVCRLFMITPEALCFDPETGAAAPGSPASVNEQMEKTYAEYPCGGFCLFAANIVDPGQLVALNEKLHSLSSIPPLISVDEEGGKVSRISGRSVFGIEKISPMGEIAKTGDPGKAYETGEYIGTYLEGFGFDLDFAPIADVNTNPSNPIIGNRAFGSDPALAALMVSAEIDGLQNSQILGCLKHFPGHGDTKTDTHSGYAETKKTWEEISACEMLPFKAGIEAGADFVMVAHIAAPNITGDGTPSSLSKTIVTEKLRNELGFSGVIITDALNMGAVSKVYSPEEAAVRALEAGCDMLLMPADYKKACDGVLQAVESGRLTEERIDESVLRILRAK